MDYKDLTQKDQKKYQKTVRMLLNNTFLVKDKKDDYDYYLFALKYQDMLNDYLCQMGYELSLDRNLGVAMIRQREEDAEGLKQYGKITLKQVQAKVLIVLWMLYMEKINTLDDEMTTDSREIMDRYNEFYGGEKNDMSKIKESLTLFKRFSLIGLVSKSSDGAFAEYKLYPSLQFGFDKKALEQIVDDMSAEFIDASIIEKEEVESNGSDSNIESGENDD